MKIFILSMIAGTLGEICCKLAAQQQGEISWALRGAAFLCWGCGAFWWTHIYKTRNILETIAWYAPTQTVILAAISIIYLKEPLTWKLLAALPMTIACIILLN
ncbi:MAG: hypothetical protein JO253_02995 [Alphaproteobacteria bacterium]|nr:hypothetical protein [Alphaproteobacteria bacterium]